MATRLGQWLMEQSKKNRISRNEIARKTHIGAATLTAITRYDHIPSVDIITTLADYFQEDRDTILELAGIVSPRSDVPAEWPAEIKSLVRRTWRLSPSDRDAVLSQMEQLVALLENRDFPDSKA